jgi:hypothetical protein
MWEPRRLTTLWASTGWIYVSMSEPAGLHLGLKHYGSNQNVIYVLKSVVFFRLVLWSHRPVSCFSVDMGTSLYKRSSFFLMARFRSSKRNFIYSENQLLILTIHFSINLMIYSPSRYSSVKRFYHL